MNQRLYLILFLFIGFVGKGQSIQHQNQIWANFNLQFPLKNQKSFQLEFSERVFTEPLQHALFAVRGVYRFPVHKKVDIGVGFANFNQTPTEPTLQPRLSIPEFRPNLDLIYKKPLGKIILENRVRIEPRMYQIPNVTRTALTGVVTLGAVRWRNRLQVMGSFHKCVDYRIGAEILLNSAVNIPTREFDQLRTIMGLTYKFTPAFQVEGVYIYQFQSKSTFDYFERDLLWFSFQYKFLKH
jgi:hypothetical protein